jgi:Tol biopolymer transport system component
LGSRDSRTVSPPRLALAICAVTAALSALVPATAGATFPGSNGKITFTRTIGGFSDVWVMDPDGQNQLQLAGDPATSQRASSFSADGERIVFVTDRPGGLTGISVMNADGSAPSLVTEFSANFPDPDFSPSGQQIVYQSLTGINEDISIIDVDGQNAKPLTTGPARDFSPSFSPDGQRIVFQREQDIWIMDADGQNQVPLTGGSTGENSPSFSPDGSRIAYIQHPPGDNPGDMWVMDSNGQNQHPLTNSPMVSDQGPVFSPDGQKIAFAQFPSGGGSDGEIIVMDANGQNPVALTQNTDFDNQVDWQPLNPPQCSLTGASKTKSVKEVVVTVLCTNENVTASATGELTAKKPKPGRAVASKKKVFSLASANGAVPEGSSTALTLQIPKKGRKTLKRSGKAGKAAVTVTLTDDLGQSTTVTQTIKVKPKRKKK